MSALAAAAAAVVDGWWQEVRSTGALPAAAAPVQARLVRAVGRAALPDGEVYLKVMAFPRGKDRWRYLLRPLPAQHEAAMLAAVAAAGVPCPEVVAVRTARRGPWPHRSMLVLRALPVAAGPAPAAAVLLRAQAAIARALAAAGLFHPDLNPDNFARLQDGRLAVLDLQSMRRTAHRDLAARRMAARLLLDARGLEPAAALDVLTEAGLVQRGAAGAGVEALARQLAHAWLRQRVRRCLSTSTEFVRCSAGPMRVVHQRRGPLPPGRWHRGGADLQRCWLGQRMLELCRGRPPMLAAFARNRAWFPGMRSVYIPATVAEDRVHEEIRTLTDGYREFRWLLSRRASAALADLQRLRAQIGRGGGG